MPANAVKYPHGSQGLVRKTWVCGFPFQESRPVLSIRSVGKAYPSLLSLLGFLSSIPSPKECAGGEKLKKELDFFPLLFSGCSTALRQLCCICIITVVPQGLLD